MRCFGCNKEVPKHKKFCTSCDAAVGLQKISGVKRASEQLAAPTKRKSSASHTLISSRDDRDFKTAKPATGHAKLVGWLVTFTKDPAGVDFRLREGRNVIGSDPHCNIYIPYDLTISGNHAIIMCRDGAVAIRDNDSMNGTYVDGTDIFGKGSVELKDRSQIRLGDSVFTFHKM